jgi:drug/metabolite transporter (DMT)-like permease
MPTLVALGVVLVWGVNFLMLKLALGQFGVLSFAFLRFAGMVGLAWAVILVSRIPLRLEPGDRLRVVTAGLIGYTGYVLLSLVGLNFTTAFSNSLLIAAAPVFSVLLLAAWRMEEVGVRRAAGLLVAGAGVAVFMLDKLAAGCTTSGLGDLISLAAAALYATYTVVLKPLTTRYPAALVTALTLTVGALPVLLFTAPDLARQEWRQVDGSGWSLLAWSIAVPVYLAWTLWSWATSRAGVAATNSFLYLVPVSTGLLSVAFLHERLGWTKAIGALLVLVGVVLVTRLRRAEKLEPPAVDSLSRPSTGAAREAGVRAGVAHLAERDLPKVEVAGSSPVSRSTPDPLVRDRLQAESKVNGRRFQRPLDTIQGPPQTPGGVRSGVGSKPP